jgi:hypothetical protein
MIAAAKDCRLLGSHTARAALRHANGRGECLVIGLNGKWSTRGQNDAIDRCCRRSQFSSDCLDWRGIEIGESLGGGSGLIVPWVSGRRRARERDGWTKGSKRQGLQVLYNGREKKFVAGAGEPAEPHAFETMVGLEVSKAHLDALAFIPRLN